MQPHLFPVFLRERMTWFGLWLGEVGTLIDTHGSVIGAITFAVVGAAGLIVYMRRDRLGRARSWIEANAVLTTLVATPFAAFVLLCLNKYLTFASATAATVGVLVALNNNNRTHDKEEKRFERQGKAARAALSLELSAICEYCVEIGNQLMKVEFTNPFMKASDAVSSLQFPAPPLTVVATLKEMINSTKHEHIADRCALLLSHIQLLKANMRWLKTENTRISRDEMFHQEIRVALVYAITESLFDFSRHGDTEIGAISWEAIIGCAELLYFDTDRDFVEYFGNCREDNADGPLEMFNFRLSKDTKTEEAIN